jgi:hypothetical protein
LPVGQTLSASYPIAISSSRSEIKLKHLRSTNAIICTIFGYEK